MQRQAVEAEELLPGLDLYPPNDAWRQASTSLGCELHGAARGPSSACGPQQQAPASAPPLLPPVYHRAAAAAARAPLHPPPLSILRSSQLDAGRLDVELASLIGEQLGRVLAGFDPARASGWEAEIQAVLNLLLFGAAIWRSPTATTPGSSLLNLKYRSEDAPGAALLPARWRGWRPRGPAAARGTHAPVAGTSSAAVPAPPALGGRSGVEGPAPSAVQRAILAAGMVAVPYVWARLGRHVAAAAAAGGEGADSWRPAAASTGAAEAAAPDGHAALGGSSSSSSLQRTGGGGVLGAALRCLGLDHWIPWVSSLLAACTQRVRALLGAAGLRLPAAGAPAHGSGGAGEGEACPRGRLGLAGGRPAAGAGPRGGAHAVWRAMRAIDAAYRWAVMLNMLVFLAGGRYRSVLERLAGTRLVYARPSMTRIISFEYLNRQLVWHEVSQLVLLLLPLLHGAKLGRGLRGRWPGVAGPAAMLRALLPSWGAGGGPRTAAAAAGGAGAGGGAPQMPAGLPEAQPARPCQPEGGAGGEGPQGQGQHNAARGAAQRPAGPCPVCGTAEVLAPVVARPCGHVFCYYCLAASCAADRWFECPLDGARVAALHRWR